MNIYQAHLAMNDLKLKWDKGPERLVSSLGNKTEYYYKLTKILNDNNIPYTNENIFEIKWKILNNDFNIKYCEHCGEILKFIKSKGYLKFCSGSCGALNRDNSTRKGFVCDEGYRKSRKTLLDTYGVEHQMHIAESHEKSQNKRYKTYSIYSPSNLEYRVQGYERYIIPNLWEKYGENDLIVKKKDIPKIKYVNKNKNRLYYPDAYIVSTNTIIEVKSIYTIKSDLLIDKMIGAIKSGYNIKVFLYIKENTIHEMFLEEVTKYLKGTKDE